MKKLVLLLTSLLLTAATLRAAPDTSTKANQKPIKKDYGKSNPSPQIKKDTGKVKLPQIKKDTDKTPRLLALSVFRGKDPADSASARQLKGAGSNTVAYPGNTLFFTISHPLEFLRSRPTDQSHVQLYVNGLPMPGLVSEWYSKVTSAQVQKGTNLNLADTTTIGLELLRSNTTQQSWNFLYRNAVSTTDSFIDISNASLGWENMAPLPSAGTPQTLTIGFFHTHEMLWWALLYFSILVLFFWLAIGSNILQAAENGPYSLSSTQLLFWTALVMGAYIYLQLLTDASAAMPSSVLYLMGISLGTTSAASLIDQGKQSSGTVVAKGHDTFIRDLLSDGNSFSVARLQTFAWNLILGGYFIVYVINNKAMPDFSSTLLLLAGFSSAAYLAGKIPENTSTAAAQQQQAAEQTQQIQAAKQSQQAQQPQTPPNH